MWMGRFSKGERETPPPPPPSPPTGLPKPRRRPWPALGEALQACEGRCSSCFSMRLHPNRVGKITMNNVGIDTDTAIRATGFVFIYIVTILIGTLLISMNDLGFMTSFSCAASCLGNIGPGFSLIGPCYNYGVLSGFSKLVCSFLMIAGRLELYTLFVLFSPYYWNPNKSK